MKLAAVKRPGDGRGEKPEAIPAVPLEFSPRLYRWFVIYLRRFFARRFTGVRIAWDGLPPESLDGPTLFYSNHASWWDPVLFMVLCSHFYPGHQGYGPMDAKALEKYRFFRKLGAFPVERDSRRGAIDFLNTGRAVLARPKASLWVTAEGKFTDARERPVKLAPGIAHLAQRVPDLSAIPLAIEYVFWNEPRPEVLVRFGAPVHQPETPAGHARDLRGVFEEALEENQNTLARMAQRRDPKAFDLLIDGKRGVGGVYDAWRRLRAMAQGKHFDPRHEEKRE
ncbi:hypothetical protein ABI59_21630 [Acidobacteria bacterium Mor1]|nr:hypothetical protein ABI59_21630 [Acidobacteria bacterium Mor1]